MKTWMKLDYRWGLLPAVTFWLALALIKYLGLPWQAAPVFLGWLWTLSLGLGVAWLKRFFARRVKPDERRAWLPHLVGVWLAFWLLTFFLQAGGWFSPLAAFLTALLLLALLVSVLPPWRWGDTWLGEFFLAVWAGLLAPSWVFILLYGVWHRWLLLLGLPLMLAFLAGFLAWDFSTFAADVKSGRRTLLISLDWPSGLVIHHLLLLSVFLLILLDVFLGIPFALLGPSFLTLFLAAFQVFLLQNLARGLPPLWSAIKINALAMPLLLLYLLSVSLVVH